MQRNWNGSPCSGPRDRSGLRDRSGEPCSGSEDDDERDSSLFADRKQESGGSSKSKIFIRLENGERVSVWRCLLLDDTEHISLEIDKPLVTDVAGDIYLTQREVIEKLKCILHESRDNTCLRIVLLARGGHFAGCVSDDNSLVAHKTFHRFLVLGCGLTGFLPCRYVVKAKAGKKQLSKDAGGRAIHSAGTSLLQYNELALKKI